MKLYFNPSWICHDILYSLSILDDFFKTIISNLPEIQTKSVNDIENILKDTKFESEEEHHIKSSELYNGMYLKYENEFPRLLTYQFITQLYFIVESEINNLFNHHKKLNNIQLSLSDYSGDLINKIELYIKQNKYNSIHSKNIQILRELYLIRNNIVHSNGIINNSEKKLARFIESNPKLSIVQRRIDISFEFCNEYLIKVNKVFLNLFTCLGYNMKEETFRFDL